MNSEPLFTKTREAHPEAERIEVKYLTMNAGCPLDDGITDWDYVITYFGDDIGPSCRVTEVALCHFQNGAIRFVFGDDVTEEAESAVRAERAAEEGGCDTYRGHRLTGADYGLTRMAGRL